MNECDDRLRVDADGEKGHAWPRRDAGLRFAPSIHWTRVEGCMRGEDRHEVRGVSNDPEYVSLSPCVRLAKSPRSTAPGRRHAWTATGCVRSATTRVLQSAGMLGPSARGSEAEHEERRLLGCMASGIAKPKPVRSRSMSGRHDGSA